MATSIKLDASLRGRVRHLAKQRRRTPHWIMREAIAQYVAREEKRESFSLHVTHAEMDTYLAKLEAGEGVEPPARHG
ncbi:hypothetical protein VL15_38655 [Burkholderia cepacia]|uniref:Ribbon-helix-helix protein CopG domain-containing protein n=1 Tax=Burkholderia cepacia TaxID=292 RepID=A0A0J5VT76_BURCE|nr:ribbon-helix-helix protein, CopG family [Burkholderia cepacia]KML38951.1 hypothetical protein VL15_38655 [Burkholderia cepacia]